MKKAFITLSVIMAVALTTSCKCQQGVSKNDLTATAWELSSIKGQAVTKSNYPNGLPNAVFTSDDKINGSGGCNRYGGTYTVDAQGKLTLSQLISTKMFCEGVDEDNYLRSLNSANRASIEGKDLVLYSENEKILVFVAKNIK